MTKVIKEVIINNVDLKKLCAKAGISLKKLSVEAGVSYEHLSRVSTGKFSMSFPYWITLKSVLDKYTKHK